MGLSFEVLASEVDEKLNPRLKPKNQPAYLSKLKAEAVAAKVDNSFIIAADSMVLLGDRIIGKPHDEKEARKMLKMLSGTTHSVITGFTILDSSTMKSVTVSNSTKIWFRKITDKEISRYVSLERPYDKAGGYAIQGVAGIFVEKIQGDYNNALGLSLYHLTRELKKFGVVIL